MPTTIHDRLTAFVRGTLGCTCPDDAFSEIVVRILSPDNPSPVRLAIEVGGRLLIHVIEEGEAVDDPTLIRRAVEDGMRARDAGGFNRFRLVVAATSDAHTDTLHGGFDAVPMRDDRAHLHVLPAASIPR